jgi:hypothetical protein
VTLEENLPSWSEYLRHPEFPGQMASSVHGALAVYDLPDLAASLPRGMLKADKPLTFARETGAATR